MSTLSIHIISTSFADGIALLHGLSDGLLVGDPRSVLCAGLTTVDEHGEVYYDLTMERYDSCSMPQAY